MRVAWRRAALAISIAGTVLLISGEVVTGRSGPPPGDGQVTLARLRWGSDLRGFRRGGFSAAWNHDYPRAEQHLSMIIKDIGNGLARACSPSTPRTRPTSLASIT